MTEHRIITRAEWGAEWADGAGSAPLPATEGFVVHQSDSAPSNGAQVIRNLERVGQSRFGAGISYSFLITPDGSIYEGHSIRRKGTHTGGHNSTVRACCFVGLFDTQPPTPAALDAASWLYQHGLDQGWWVDRISGHRDWKATACPGDALYALLPTIANPGAPESQEDDDMTPEQAATLAETADKVDELDDKVNAILLQVGVLYEQLIGTKGTAGPEALRQLFREDAADSDRADKQTRTHLPPPPNV